MLRWLQAAGLAIAGLVLLAFVLPVHELAMEGGLRGVVPASDVRAIGLVAASIPFVILLLLVASSRRFRSGVTPWMASLAAFLVSVGILAYLVLQR